jgi:hypothetical protein
VRGLFGARRTSATLVAAAMLAVAGAGYALASGSASITACVSKHGGTLYKAKRCKSGDSKLTWSKTGPRGKSGARGAAGAPGTTGATGPAGAAGAAGAPGTPGFVQLGSWAGDVATLTGPGGTTRSFLGPTTTLATTATQSIAASGSAALGTTTATTQIALGICIQPSTGGTVSLLDPNPGTAIEVVTVNTTRIPYAAAGAGTPGAGTWNVGICAVDLTGQSVDSNDWSLGFAFVSNGALVPGSTSLRHSH